MVSKDKRSVFSEALTKAEAQSKVTGIIIAQLREEKGLTQEQLAKILEIERSTLANWEVGYRTPSRPNLQKIASYFKVSTDYLLGLSPINTSVFSKALDKSKEMYDQRASQDHKDARFLNTYEKSQSETQEYLIVGPSIIEGLLISNSSVLDYIPINSTAEISYAELYIIEGFLKPLNLSEHELLSLIRKNTVTGKTAIDLSNKDLLKKLNDFYGTQWRNLVTTPEWGLLAYTTILKRIVDGKKTLETLLPYLRKVEMNDMVNIIEPLLAELAEFSSKRLLSERINDASDLISLIDNNEILLNNRELTTSEKDRLKDYLNLSLELIQRDRQEETTVNPNADSPEINKKNDKR